MSERVRYALAGLAAILWIVSFFLPVARTGNEWNMGWHIAGIGFYGPAIGQFGWYANLTMIPALGVLALGDMPEDRKGIQLHAILSFLFWFNSLFFDHLQYDAGRSNIQAFGAGYFAWMAALLIVWAGLAFIWWRDSQARAATKSDKCAGDGVERRNDAMLEGRP